MRISVSEQGLKFLEDRRKEEIEDQFISDKLNNIDRKTFEQLLASQKNPGIAKLKNNGSLSARELFSTGRSNKSIAMGLNADQRKKLFQGLINLPKLKRQQSRFKHLVGESPKKSRKSKSTSRLGRFNQSELSKPSLSIVAKPAQNGQKWSKMPFFTYFLE